MNSEDPTNQKIMETLAEKKSLREAVSWLNNPNKSLDNEKPFMLMDRDESDLVYSVLLEEVNDG